MSASPRVSVLLPCRNAAETVDATLASLAGQTFDDYEILAVDDGSTDETRGILTAWQRRDARVKPVHTEPRGIVAALNEAARHASADIFLRMDADDLAHPARFERQLAFLEDHPDLAACGTLVRYIPSDAVRDGARRYESWINSVVTPAEIERDLFVECPIPHPSLAIRREFLERVGGYLDRGWPEDYDLVLRLWAAGQRMGKVPETLLDWRERPNRLSRTDQRYDEEAFRRCKVHFIGRRVGGRPVVIWGAGPVGKAFARALAAEGHDLHAFVDLDPRKIGQVIHGAPVVSPKDVVAYRDAYVLAAVGQPNARAEIRESLDAVGFREVEDYCAVA